MRIIENMLGSERATGKRRVDKGGNLEEEAREDKNGREGRGMGNRKGVVQQRFERAHHFCRGGGRRGEGGGGGGDASLIRRRRGNEKWGIDGARRGRKRRIKELEGVAEDPLSTGIFNGNTRRNIVADVFVVDVKSRGRCS